MPRPRYTQISLDDTPYYHCVSRCVRRAFLCGEDHHLGRNFEHRRQWILDKLFELSDVFSMDLCAYAIMSNHYHVVLHVDRGQAADWCRDEVIRRWHCLFNGSALSRRLIQGDRLLPVELDALDSQVAIWRARLMDISWFMRVLNESIARRANEEDGCTGRFWEGRFKCQALLDEAALAACMAYVDLNPVRAGVAKTPEASDYTSVQQRILKATSAHMPNHPSQQTHGLMGFAGNPRQDMPRGLPFRLTDYLDLVDWTGRILREDKHGAIPADSPCVLDRLGLEQDHWRYLTTHFESRFKGLVGHAYRLKQVARNLGLKRPPGLGACLKYLSRG